VTTGVVRSDEFFKTFHYIMMVLGLGTEDGQISSAIINEDECLIITTEGWSGKELKIEKDSLSDVGRWGRLTCDVEVLIVEFADGTCEAGAVEAPHEIDICTG
jgi:hypothetical protein